MMVKRSSSSTGSHVPASAKATAASISAAMSASISAIFVGVHQPGLFQPGLQLPDRIVFAPGLDFLLGAIELRVEHRMGAEPVGAAFQQIRLAGPADRRDRPLRRDLHRDDIHAVHRFAR